VRGATCVSQVSLHTHTDTHSPRRSGWLRLLLLLVTLPSRSPYTYCGHTAGFAGAKTRRSGPPLTWTLLPQRLVRRVSALRGQTPLGTLRYVRRCWLVFVGWFVLFDCLCAVAWLVVMCSVVQGTTYTFAADSAQNTVGAATLQSSIREFAECANRGVCEPLTGVCACFSGYGTRPRVVWCGVVWCSVVWCGMWCVVWCVLRGA